MSRSRILVDLHRADGEVTRLKGGSAIVAVTEGQLTTRLEANEPPQVSTRCSTGLELAWNLAGLISAIRSTDPNVLRAALELTDIMDADRPLFRRELPDLPPTE